MKQLKQIVSNATELELLVTVGQVIAITILNIELTKTK